MPERPEYELEWGEIIQGAQGEGDQIIGRSQKIVISNDSQDPDQEAIEKANGIVKKLSSFTPPVLIVKKIVHRF